MSAPPVVWPPPGIDWLYSDSRTAIACGDCMELLPKMPKGDLIVTDAPYEICTFSPTKGKSLYVKRDNLRNIKALGIDTFSPAKYMPLLWENCQHAYVWTSKNCLPEFMDWIRANGIDSWDLLVMSKTNPIPAKRFKYLPDTEIILFFRGKGCCFNNDQPYEFYRKVKPIEVHPPEYGHPTEKSVGVIGQLIQVSSKPGHLIIDPFMGSGSTLESAKSLNRYCIGIEIDEGHCRRAADRLSQGVMFGAVTDAEPPAPVVHSQTAMFAEE